MVWAQFNFNLYEVCNARQKIKDFFKKTYSIHVSVPFSKKEKKKKTYSKIGYFPVVICK